MILIPVVPVLPLEGNLGSNKTYGFLSISSKPGAKFTSPNPEDIWIIFSHPSPINQQHPSASPMSQVIPAKRFGKFRPKKTSPHNLGSSKKTLLPVSSQKTKKITPGKLTLTMRKTTTMNESMSLLSKNEVLDSNAIV